MWRGWLSMTQFLMDQTLSVEEEMVQLQIEEEKAQLGGWQGTTTGLTTDLSSFSSTRIAPRDLLAWRLRTSAVQFMRGRAAEWLCLRIFKYVFLLNTGYSLKNSALT